MINVNLSNNYQVSEEKKEKFNFALDKNITIFLISIGQGRLELDLYFFTKLYLFTL